MRKLVAAAVVLLGTAIAIAAHLVRAELRPLEGPPPTLPPGLTAIAAGRTYAYLIEAPRGLVLVDTGSDVEGRAIRDELARRGKSEADVVAVLLTSAHPEVLAAAHRFQAATLYSGPEDEQLVQGERFASALLSRLLGRWVVRRKRMQPLVPVLSGARLDVAGALFEAVATPGVTRGGRTWLTGGVAFVGRGVTIDGGEITWPGRLMADRPRDLRRSLPRLASFAFTWVAAARGAASRDQISALLAEPR